MVFLCDSLFDLAAPECRSGEIEDGGDQQQRADESQGAGQRDPERRGAGVDLDGELAYTWTDADPENATNVAGLADYDAFEIGTGIAIEF